MPGVKGFIAGMFSNSGNYDNMNPDSAAREKKKKKKLVVLSLFAALLLVAAVAGIASGAGMASGATSRKTSSFLDAESHVVVKSACSSTRYPELCYSAVAKKKKKKVSSQKEVIELSVNLTIAAVQLNYNAVKKLTKTAKGLTKREKVALNDCLETIDDTLDELHEVRDDLDDYPGGGKTLSRHADDLRTLLSAAMTNQETCLDGFSHDKADERVREALIEGQLHVEKMCSNVLAMIGNMTNSDIAATTAAGGNKRRLLFEVDGEGWPEWMSAGDRRLMQSGAAPAGDAVVAKDGSGDFTTVAEAVAAAPTNSEKRYVIRIKAGVYRENVDVSSRKRNIMFYGDGRTTTIITASLNVVDGSTTFRSATVAAVGAGFLARDVTFENTAGPSKHQAVALRVGSDLSAFYRCSVLAYQDSLYVHSNRQFFVDCFVAGTVDFIFGNAAALLQRSVIRARRPNPGQRNMVTAQGRTDPNQNTGIVIQDCDIGATADLLPVQGSFPTYLGRPWKEYSQTVIMQSKISDVIRPEGWHVWSGTFALDTLTYREYANTGPGADTSKRVTWKGFKVITNSSEALQYTAAEFIGGGNWLEATGFPFSLGL